MSPKFLAISDIHLGLKLFNLPELEQDMRDNFSRAIDLAISLKVAFVFIVGDLYEHNRPSPDLIDFVRGQAEKANANGVVLAGIAGDHDKPINGSSWIYLSGIVPVSSIGPQYVGMDYCDNSPSLIPQIAALTYKESVEWLFLHGHVPELFRYTTEKKLLDIKQLDLIKNFPNIKGVILGDIHVPTDTKIHDPTGNKSELPYIGYCGSLGITKTDEIGQKTGLLYFDGNKLTRHPFELTRTFVRLNLADSISPINWVAKFTAFFKDNKGKKPVIIVEYDKSSEELLPTIAPLYDIGIVKKMRVLPKSKTDSDDPDDTRKQVINLRSELKTNERISSVLSECLPDKEVFDLAHDLLNNVDDQTTILDNFKRQYFDE